MKLLTALIALLLFSAISQAQIPFYGMYATVQPYYATVQPYYPGAIALPYLPQAYYPQPYVFPPNYTPYPVVENQFAVYDNRQNVDALERQVQQLSEDLRLLQDQVTASEAQAQMQMQIQAQRSEVSRPAQPAVPVVLVLKNGERLECQGYVIAGDTLWIVTPGSTERMSLSNINVAATQRENLKRGIEFPNVGG